MGKVRKLFNEFLFVLHVADEVLAPVLHYVLAQS